jgi:hypothetical protein
VARVALGGGAWGGEQVVVEVARRLPEVLHCARGRRAGERTLLPAEERRVLRAPAVALEQKCGKAHRGGFCARREDGTLHDSLFGEGVSLGIGRRCPGRRCRSAMRRRLLHASRAVSAPIPANR